MSAQGVHDLVLHLQQIAHNFPISCHTYVVDADGNLIDANVSPKHYANAVADNQVLHDAAQLLEYAGWEPSKNPFADFAQSAMHNIAVLLSRFPGGDSIDSHLFSDADWTATHDATLWDPVLAWGRASAIAAAHPSAGARVAYGIVSVAQTADNCPRWLCFNAPLFAVTDTVDRHILDLHMIADEPTCRVLLNAPGFYVGTFYGPRAAMELRAVRSLTAHMTASISPAAISAARVAMVFQYELGVENEAAFVQYPHTVAPLYMPSNPHTLQDAVNSLSLEALQQIWYRIKDTYSFSYIAAVVGRTLFGNGDIAVGYLRLGTFADRAFYCSHVKDLYTEKFPMQPHHADQLVGGLCRFGSPAMVDVAGHALTNTFPTVVGTDATNAVVTATPLVGSTGVETVEFATFDASQLISVFDATESVPGIAVAMSFMKTALIANGVVFASRPRLRTLVTYDEYCAFGQRCHMDNAFFPTGQFSHGTPQDQSDALVEFLVIFRNSVLDALPNRDEARRPTRRKALVWRAAAMTISQIDAFMASHF